MYLPRALPPLLLAASLLVSGDTWGEDSTSRFFPDAQLLFEGCEATEDGTSGRSYECPGVQAGLTYVNEQLSRTPPPALLESSLQALKLTLEGEVTAKPGTLKFRDRSQPAYHLSVKEKASGKLLLEGYVTVDRASSGRGRISTCFAETGEPRGLTKCRRMLEYFARKGPPEPIDLELASLSITRAPQIGSRVVKVPRDCRLEMATEYAGLMRCPASILNWNVLEPGPEPSQWMRAIVELFRRQHGTALTEREVRCTVEKQPAACVQLTGQSNAKRIVTYVGAARIQELGVSVTCTFFGEGEAPPAVCSDVLGFEVLGR